VSFENIRLVELLKHNASKRQKSLHLKDLGLLCGRLVASDCVMCIYNIFGSIHIN